MIRRGADDFDVRMRYGRRAQMLLALPLEAAMSRVEFWYRAERKAHQIACAFGRANAAALIPLQSIRLLLRLLRRKRLHAEWPALVDAVAAPRFHLIAAE
jgi:hypothetical protein